MHNEQNDIFLAYYSSYFDFRCLVEIKHTHSATIWSTIILQTFRAFVLKEMCKSSAILPKCNITMLYTQQQE